MRKATTKGVDGVALKAGDVIPGMTFKILDSEGKLSDKSPTVYVVGRRVTDRVINKGKVTLFFPKASEYPTLVDRAKPAETIRIGEAQPAGEEQSTDDGGPLQVVTNSPARGRRRSKRAKTTL